MSEEGEASAEAVSAPKRVVLKISGEAFGHPGERGIAMDAVEYIAGEISEAAEEGARMAIVMGGGNILRGAHFTIPGSSIQEATAHYMGMLATVMNGLALQDALEAAGRPTRLMTAIRIDDVAEPYIRRRAQRHQEKGRLILLASGTGRPFVTTDTAAAQWALELGADVLLKGTRVDGVFSDDPEKNPHAVRYSELTYDDFLRQNLRVMDHEAVTKCAQYRLPIRVFNFRKPGNIRRAVRGERIGTLIARSVGQGK